jgi:hypothetical protein
MLERAEKASGTRILLTLKRETAFFSFLLYFQRPGPQQTLRNSQQKLEETEKRRNNLWALKG